MFAFRKVPCILCDQQVARREALAVSDHKGYTVCRACIERWQSAGGMCPHCRTPLRIAQEPGIFLEGQRTFGHLDCGASRLVAA